MIHLGAVPAGTTVYIPFTTYAGSTGASVTCSGLAVTDIEIYKNGSTTQRASDAGFTLLDTDGIDFDSITGLHGFSVDLSDNTDSGFFAVGSWYWVVVSAITVDSQTVTFLAATFRICPAETAAGVPKTDVSHISGDSTAADTLELFVEALNQTTGQLDAGSFDGVLPANFEDMAIEATTGIVEANVVEWLGTAPATPTVAGVPEVDVTHILGEEAEGAAGVIDANVVSVSGDTTAADTLELFAEALDQTTGQIDSGSFASGAINAAAIATDAIGADEIAAGAVTKITTGLATATNVSDAQTAVLAKLPSALVSGRIDASVGAVATDAITAAAIAAAAANKLADHARRRTQANVESSSDGDSLSIGSLYGLIQQAQESNTEDNAGKLTVYRTDGTTELAQKDIATDAGAEPVVGVS
jgi:23S rRNA U2552 (ribose-2'-O)-methylase RlmE/FtsJ